MSVPLRKRMADGGSIASTEAKKLRISKNKENMTMPAYSTRDLNSYRDFMTDIPKDSLCAAYMNIREQISQQQRINDYVLMHLNKKPVLIDTQNYTVRNNKFIAEDSTLGEEEKEGLTKRTFGTMMDLNENNFLELQRKGIRIKSEPPIGTPSLAQSSVNAEVRQQPLQDLLNFIGMSNNEVTEIQRAKTLYPNPRIIDSAQLKLWFNGFLNTELELSEATGGKRYNEKYNSYNLSGLLKHMGLSIGTLQQTAEGAVNLIEIPDDNQLITLITPEISMRWQAERLQAESLQAENNIAMNEDVDISKKKT